MRNPLRRASHKDQTNKYFRSHLKIVFCFGAVLAIGCAAHNSSANQSVDPPIIDLTVRSENGGLPVANAAVVVVCETAGPTIMEHNMQVSAYRVGQTDSIGHYALADMNCSFKGIDESKFAQFDTNEHIVVVHPLYEAVNITIHRTNEKYRAMMTGDGSQKELRHTGEDVHSITITAQPRSLDVKYAQTPPVDRPYIQIIDGPWYIQIGNSVRRKEDEQNLEGVLPLLLVSQDWQTVNLQVNKILTPK